MADATLEQLQNWLSEAQLARHKLALGHAVASVNYEGRGQVSYNKADLAGLENYIASLESRIAALTGTQTMRRQPIYFRF